MSTVKIKVFLLHLSIWSSAIIMVGEALPKGRLKNQDNIKDCMEGKYMYTLHKQNILEEGNEKCNI